MQGPGKDLLCLLCLTLSEMISCWTSLLTSAALVLAGHP